MPKLVSPTDHIDWPCDVEPPVDAGAPTRTPFAYAPPFTFLVDQAYLAGCVPGRPITRGELIFGLAILAIAVIALLTGGGLS